MQLATFSKNGSRNTVSGKKSVGVQNPTRICRWIQKRKLRRRGGTPCGRIVFRNFRERCERTHNYFASFFLLYFSVFDKIKCTIVCYLFNLPTSEYVRRNVFILCSVHQCIYKIIASIYHKLWSYVHFTF